MALPKRRGKTAEFRSADYDRAMAYYDRMYHNKAPSELTSRQMALKINLRNWLNNQQTLRRRPKLVNGNIPDDAPEIVRQRYVPK